MDDFATAAAADRLRVERRHVFYVPGYDARGLRSYLTMFRDGVAGLRSHYGVEAEATRPVKSSDGRQVRWHASVRGAGWEVDTTYDYLDWSDIVRADLSRPLWWKLGRSLPAYARFVASGAWPRIMRATWRFGLFCIYPLVAVLAFAVLGLLAGWAASAVATAYGLHDTVARGLFALVAVAAFLVVYRAPGRKWYVDYLLVDFLAMLDHARRRRPDWDERIDALSEALVRTVAETDADEVVVVGHSSGSFMAVDVVARALEKDPDLGARGPRLCLLTLGSVLPVVGFMPEAGWFRDRVARLAVERRLDWVEYQSRKDVISVSRFDPVAGHGIDPGRARVNPAVQSVRFRNVVEPETYARIRLRFFALHFLFVGPVERPGDYDYHAMVLGPVPLALRVAAGHATAARAMSADAAGAAAAWRDMGPLASPALVRTAPRERVESLKL